MECRNANQLVTVVADCIGASLAWYGVCPEHIADNRSYGLIPAIGDAVRRGSWRGVAQLDSWRRTCRVSSGLGFVIRCRVVLGRKRLRNLDAVSAVRSARNYYDHPDRQRRAPANRGLKAHPAPSTTVLIPQQRLKVCFYR